MGNDLRGSDYRDRDSGPATTPLDDDQHSRGELSVERPKEGWLISAGRGRSGPASPLSLPRNLAERSSPSRLRFAAQNRRGLDRSGPFYEHCSVMRERGLMNLGFSGASRWSASESFWVGTFSTGTMGTFQPELTRLLIVAPGRTCHTSERVRPQPTAARMAH